MHYPLAKNSIFRTIQGEGSLLGTPMIFVRLAGCSIGCPQCDTDYRLDKRLTVAEIGEQVRELGPCAWTWVTGGEPADHDLWPLFEELRLCGRIALATSGHKHLGTAGRLVDFLSVSPHSWGDDWKIRSGSQVNIVPGLNGLRLEEMPDGSCDSFTDRWVTPLEWQHADIQNCVEWVYKHPGWRLSIQAHKTWGLP